MTLEGYIKLYRKIKENCLWLEPRRFHKAEAWIDMLLRAGHKEVDITIGAETYHLKRGEFITSQLKLSEAWGWNRETVKVFLDLLTENGQIGYKPSNKFTIISIRNWDLYQNPQPATDPTTKQHQTDINSGTINNVKNGKTVNSKDLELLLTKALEELNKIATPQVVAKWLSEIPPRYHHKIRYFLVGRYTDGGQVYDKAKDEHDKNKYKR